MECEECSGKCEGRSGGSNVTCETGRHFRRVHARAWLAHGACKFYRRESYIYIYIYIYIPKATSPRPRAGTTVFSLKFFPVHKGFITMDNGYSDAHDSGEIADPPFCNISFFL